MASLRLAPDYTEFLQLYYKYPAHRPLDAGMGYQNAWDCSTPLTEPCLISRDAFLLWPLGAVQSPTNGVVSQVCQQAVPQVPMNSVPSVVRPEGGTQATRIEEIAEEGQAAVKFVQGKVSTAVAEPKKEHTARRIAVEAQIAETMDDVPFNLKCQIYRTELQAIVKEQQQLITRTHVPALKSPPVLKLNSYERGLLPAAGPLELMPASFAQVSSVIRGRTNEDIFQEILNSLTNRILFLVMIEYRSWFPQDRARSQIVRCVLEALDSQPLPAAVSDYVANFVVQRTKNFRDVISRVCKRDKRHGRSSSSHAETEARRAS